MKTYKIPKGTEVQPIWIKMDFASLRGWNIHKGYNICVTVEDWYFDAQEDCMSGFVDDFPVFYVKLPQILYYINSGNHSGNLNDIVNAFVVEKKVVVPIK